MIPNTDFLDGLAEAELLLDWINWFGSEVDATVLGSVFSCFRGPMELNCRSSTTSLE
jgi:hypothetical protein